MVTIKMNDECWNTTSRLLDEIMKPIITIDASDLKDLDDKKKAILYDAVLFDIKMKAEIASDSLRTQITNGKKD